MKTKALFGDVHGPCGRRIRVVRDGKVILFILFTLTCCEWAKLNRLLAVSASVSPSPISATNDLILRVRKPNGSTERVQIPLEQRDTITLQDILHRLDISDDAVLSQRPSSSTAALTVQADGSILTPEQTMTQTLSQLGLKHGSLIAVAVPKSPTTSILSSRAHPRKRQEVWDPFPELAKDYSAAQQRARTRRAAAGGLSYADLALLQAALHTVEPQPQGPLQRLYMCRLSAERFHAAAVAAAGSGRCALLWGTLQRERVDGPTSSSSSSRRARTSLSSNTVEQEYCQVAKVQALWEPPVSSLIKASKEQPRGEGGGENIYDPQTLLQHVREDEMGSRVWRVARWLDLQPVGWIFTHHHHQQQPPSAGRALAGKDRNKSSDDHEEDGLPVWAEDIKTGALLQIEKMKALGRIEGSRFVTLAMEATTGATEAFQLSDVCVQMVAEGLWDGVATGGSSGRQQGQEEDSQHVLPDQRGRQVRLLQPVLVDARETHQLDSVLCLVNTALLSHIGSYAGLSTATSTVNKNGALTKKTRKALLAALKAPAVQANDGDGDNDGELLKLLCEFNTLVALDELLGPADSEVLCACVKKWARGQRLGTRLDQRLKRRLQTILET